jgi:mono/diheme cytochrome c family protein
MDIRRRSLLTLLFILVAALVVAGCGGSDDDSGSDDGDSKATTSESSDSGDEGGSDSGGSADGKSLFAKTCGGCHTLADAGTSGSAGPNLDDLKPDEGTVRTQIENGGGGMPAGLLEGEEADAVAAYVAANAGK